MAAAKKTEEITIRKVEYAKCKIRIIGDSPIIIHAWSEKARKEMLDAQTDTPKTKKKPCKMPFDDFARALYWLTTMPTETIKDPCNGEMREIVTEDLFDKAIEEGARFGFPINAFKMAGNSAAYRKGWVKNQMSLRGAYFLESEDGGELVEIKGDKPKIREDMVKLQGSSSDLRYRPVFENWYCDMTLTLDTGFGLKMDDIINVINAGGSSCGVGEWRIERDGIFGRYHVEILK